MKKNTIVTRVIAIIMAMTLIFSACSALSASAAKAETVNAKYAREQKGADEVPKKAYDAGMEIIKKYVPEGDTIATVVNLIVDSYQDEGPSLVDISNQIADLRNEMCTQFAEIKEQMKQYAEEIENKIVDQTVIAGKGVGFDKLMTALQTTDRQINSISNDDTLNDNEKAVEVAALIGKNTEWVESSNLYFQYLDFMNTLAAPTFADQKDRDLYQVVYSDFTSKAMFSGETLNMSQPYIERVMLLGLYAYSINAQCLKAAQTVSEFTEADEATLNKDELNTYHDIKSLTSIVNGEIININDKMFETETADTVVNHFNKYESIDRTVFINNGTDSRKLDAEMRVGCFSDVGDSKALMNIVDIMDSYNFSMDELKAVAEHVKATYPGTSLRTFLSDVGFNMTNVPQDALISVGNVNVYDIEYITVGGALAAKGYSNFPSISIDDNDVNTVDRDCYAVISVAGGAQYAEVLSNAYIINFNVPD